MADNKTLSTQNAGTFNLTYNATDESGNVTAKTRNVFILASTIDPVFQLIDGNDNMNANSFTTTSYLTQELVSLLEINMETTLQNM